MKASNAAFLLGALTTVLAACAPTFAVQTAGRPGVDLRSYRTFSVLTPPLPRDSATLPADHPMLIKSTSNRELQNAMLEGLWDHGYRAQEPEADGADLLVAYYAALHEVLDATRWDYGYGCRLTWWRVWERQMGFTEAGFPPGTVIIDLLDARTGEVLWRGLGVAATSGNVRDYQRSLQAVVREMLAQLPPRQ